jgi:hypothetical protein
MRKEKPFDIARPRTPKNAARVREKIMMEKMTALLSVSDEESFKKKLESAFGIKPGSQQFNAALNAWREASSSQ